MWRARSWWRPRSQTTKRPPQNSRPRHDTAETLSQLGIADQIEQQWNAQRKAITDLAERQWKAQKKAIEDVQNAIGGMFRRKPE